MPFCIIESMIRLAALVFFLFAITGSVASAHTNDSLTISNPKKMTVTDVLQQHTDAWMKIPGVIGTGEGQLKGKPCITIFIVKPSDKIKKGIPKTVEGYPVVFKTTGTIKAY